MDYIAQRDGYRCHLCLKSVPMDKRVPHPLAPTFDHLIPRSAINEGASDTKVNVRLAHFECNWRRRDKGTVQLLLVG